MTDGSLSEAAWEVMQRQVGIVIPVYFPRGVDNDLGRELLRDTIHGYVQQMDDPASLCLSVDGADYGKEILSVRSFLRPYFKLNHRLGSFQGI